MNDLYDGHESFVALEEAQSLGGSLLTGTETTILSGGDDSVPDVLRLNYLCARTVPPKETEESKFEAEQSWESVREWLSSHSAEEVRAAAEQRGDSGLTALHFACRHNPPLEVVEVLLSIAGDTSRWPDAFGWLPIHYACASGSDSAVIQALVESYPESKTATDHRGRTPLHFALGDKPATPEIIFLLSSSGAAGYKDDIGMLPLHYACAFGASEEALYVLTDAYPEAIHTGDKRKRTPLHFALSNAGREGVAAAVRLLINLDHKIVNSVDGGPLPLRVLAEYARTIRSDYENHDVRRDSVHRCLEYLLNAKPEPTADFFTALQSLPEWLSEKAVVMPVVQILLNEKIAQRFPTAVLLGDFIVQVMVIIAYSWNVVDNIHRRFDANVSNDAQPRKYLIPLYLGAAYFLMREFIQVVSLISLKVFKLWLYDPSNYLNIAYIALIASWAFVMDRGIGDKDTFRIGATFSVIIVWLKLLAYLRNTLFDFAVFVGGVFYVVQRLAAFLCSLGIILIAFAQMFLTVYQQTEYCLVDPYENADPNEAIIDTQCDSNHYRSYCNFWLSFLSVYNMLLGEVSDIQFYGNGQAIALFVIFMFLVVILLSNVLIAIVTDSYKVIQDRRAAIVFWTNRLDFVAEMDAIANGPWKVRLKQAFGSGDNAQDLESNHKSGALWGKELWKQIMDLFEEEVYEGSLSVEFIVYTALRFITAVVIVPCWILLGLLTFGWLWPPQVREGVLTSTIFKHTKDLAKDEELRKTQVKLLNEEVKELKDELLQELVLDRTQLLQMKSQVAERKLEIANEMKDIKRLVAILFERQSG